MKIKRILLDLDDVLNCCTMDALRYVGCPVDPLDDSKFNPAWGWDIVRAANELHPCDSKRPLGVFTVDSFWRLVKRDFWANIPKSKECNWLIEGCAQAVGKENVCILTAPILDPDCLAGKLEWIHKFMPVWMHRQYLMGPCKHFCAKPDSLLIDDRDKNVEDFRAAGGLAIQMPRPWNLANGLGTLAFTLALRKELYGPMK